MKLLFPHPAVLIEDRKTKTLAIADPHIGWETPLREKGIHIPSQTSKLKQRLTALLSRYKPDSLLILGDVKYSVISAKPGEWHDVPRFLEELGGYVERISIIRGNHDANLEPLLPEKANLLPAVGAVIGDVGLFHGHKWPSPNLLRCKTLIMGHLHPVVVFRDPAGFKITKQVWIKANCNTSQLSRTLIEKSRLKIEGSPEETLKKLYGFKPRASQILIMPSFNDFLGGKPVNEVKSQRDRHKKTMIGPVLRSEAVDLDGSEIYLLDGTYLGTLASLASWKRFD